MPGLLANNYSLLLIAVAISIRPERLERSRVVQTTHCLHCKYSLNGLPLSGVCPECGSPYEEKHTVALPYGFRLVWRAGRERLFWCCVIPIIFVLFMAPLSVVAEYRRLGYTAEVTANAIRLRNDPPPIWVWYLCFGLWSPVLVAAFNRRLAWILVGAACLAFSLTAIFVLRYSI